MSATFVWTPFFSAAFLSITSYLSFCYTFGWVRIQVIRHTLLSDWYRWPHWCWQIHADFGFVPYPGESWRKNCYWWHWCLSDWTSWSAIETHHHPTGNNIDTYSVHGLQRQSFRLNLWRAGVRIVIDSFYGAETQYNHIGNNIGTYRVHKQRRQQFKFNRGRRFL